MRTLLFHVSKAKIEDVIRPGADGKVYMTKDKFVSQFGNWVYVFCYDDMAENFDLEERVFPEEKGRWRHLVPTGNGLIRVEGASIGSEFTVTGPINLDLYCIGRFEHFDESRDVIIERVVREQVLSLQAS